MKRIAFDLDGTLTESWHCSEKRSRQAVQGNWIASWLIKRKLIRLKPFMIPLAANIEIITCRPRIFETISWQWIKKTRRNNTRILGTYNFVYIHSPTEFLPNKERTKWKAETINEHGIEEYYEDEKEIRKRLSYLCPDTEILEPEEAIRRGRAI